MENSEYSRALAVDEGFRNYPSTEYPKASGENITQTFHPCRRGGTAERPVSPWGWECGMEWSEKVGSIRTHKRRMIRIRHRPGAHKHRQRPAPDPGPKLQWFGP